MTGFFAKFQQCPLNFCPAFVIYFRTQTNRAMKRQVIVTITRDEDNNATVSYDMEIGNKFHDEAIANELTNMLIEYDDVTVVGMEIDTINGARFVIEDIFNNISKENLTKEEIESAYYHAFAPHSIII